MDFVKQIVNWLEERKIFSRQRKSNNQRALEMLLYYAGLSYEKAGMFAGASYEAIREWYQKGGTWYPWALGQAGFQRYTVVSFGPRSAIERLFGDIEWRIRRFWNGFIGKYSRESMERWIGSFAGFRNWMKES
jgi:hypothetical protein